MSSTILALIGAIQQSGSILTLEFNILSPLSKKNFANLVFSSKLAYFR